MHYEPINPSDLILRDHLALDRTELANERTLLAYQRTAIMLLISSITVMKLFVGNLWMECFGAVLLPLAIIIGGFGFWRFLRFRAKIARALAPSQAT